MIAFQKFLERYKEIWRNCSLEGLKEILSTEYKAREIMGKEIVDFGYDESINGWKQGFEYVRNNHAQWRLDQLAVIPLRADEVMVIFSATIVVRGKSLEAANLFFNTFRNDNNEWKLVRSYIEAGIPIEKLNDVQFSSLGNDS
jgi:hypothetical protein